MSLSRRAFLGIPTAGQTRREPASTAGDERARPRRIVLLAGPASHGYGEHEHPAGCRLMADRLGRLDGIEARVVEGWPEDASVLDEADALIVYGDGGAAHPLAGRFEALEPLARRGAGLGFLHYALIVDGREDRRRMLDWIGGYYELDWSVNPMWTAELDSLPQHPIARGIAPFALEDEWYYHMRFRPKMASVVPLLTALPPASSLERPDGPHSGNPHVRRAVLEEGRSQHLAWCTQRADGGRGFGFTGLHWHWNWAHDDFRTFLLNAACWLARVPVPEDSVPSARPSLDELVELAGPPPEGWERGSAERRMERWQQPPAGRDG